MASLNCRRSPFRSRTRGEKKGYDEDAEPTTFQRVKRYSDQNAPLLASSPQSSRIAMPKGERDDSALKGSKS